MTTAAKDYQGWANYETWNVALDINNNSKIYFLARNFMMQHEKKPAPFQTFVNAYKLTSTIDNVLYTHPDLNTNELDRLMNELIEE
jgi:hypothetical protein